MPTTCHMFCLFSIVAGSCTWSHMHRQLDVTVIHSKCMHPLTKNC